MAVPKTRTSYSKKKIRKQRWLKKIDNHVELIRGKRKKGRRTLLLIYKFKPYSKLKKKVGLDDFKDKIWTEKQIFFKAFFSSLKKKRVSPSHMSSFFYSKNPWTPQKVNESIKKNQNLILRLNKKNDTVNSEKNKTP